MCIDFKCMTMIKSENWTMQKINKIQIFVLLQVYEFNEDLPLLPGLRERFLFFKDFRLINPIASIPVHTKLSPASHPWKNDLPSSLSGTTRTLNSRRKMTWSSSNSGSVAIRALAIINVIPRNKCKLILIAHMQWWSWRFYEGCPVAHIEKENGHNKRLLCGFRRDSRR